jgi:hypothetical protein
MKNNPTSPRLRRTSNKFAKYLHYTALIILIIITAFWFVFALLSGAEEYDGGLRGIVMNSPNALPFLILLIFVYITWKWRLIGGSIIFLMGLFTIFAFNAFREPVVLFAISLPLMVFGGGVVWSWYLERE